MSDKIVLKVTKRQTGKGVNRSLRRQSQVPAVVYGTKVKNAYFSLKENELEKYLNLQHENSIFVLNSEEKSLNNLKVLKKDVEYHPVSRRPIHVDFYAVDLTKKVKVSVDVQFTGKAKGVTEQGGIFQEVRRNVEVECLPEEIPEFFELDISNLDLHESLHVSDLTVGDNVKVLTQEKTTLATVVEPQKEEEKKEEEASTDPLKQPEEAKTTAAAKEGDQKEEKQEEKKEDKKEDKK